MPLNTILHTQKVVLEAFSSLADLAPTHADLSYHESFIDANGEAAYLTALNTLFAGQSNATMGHNMLVNLGLTAVFTDAQAEAYLAASANRVAAVIAVAELLSTGDFTGSATLIAAQNAYNEKIEYAYNWAANETNTYNIDLSDALAPDMTGKIFNLTAETAAGADVMRLTGDQDVRIDFTVNNNQIKGLDLNGNGVINNDGVENNNPTTLDDGHDFEIVDAYARDLLNHYNRAANFLGDIYFDGTGFAGDGVSTNGNIFLGGLGADQAAGGIGNDFMAGGGVGEQNSGQDFLFGGRNADFFHVTLSALDSVSGDALDIDGGETSDDSWPDSDEVPDLSSSQDSDWVLIEASDDDEPVLIDLGSTSEGGTIRTEFMEDDNGDVDAGDANDAIDIIGIENVDASGNLYGFLDDIDVAIGENGQVVGGENVGIGSSAQLRIIGSDNANILIGGFDNDRIDGDSGNDLLFGGRLDYNNNPNMQAIVNDGMDALYGGAGNDHIVFEADGGLISGDGGTGSDDQTSGNDTLWLTSLSLGTQTAAQMTTDSVLRFELQNGDTGGDGNDTYAGYGGADADGTADQTNYADSSNRVSVTDMENVIATGMGAIDYLAAGSNDPELIFNNQQNLRAYEGDLDLRGSSGMNTLYASTGNDVLEGRESGTLTTRANGTVSSDGRDKLSGGDGNDDFYFELTDGTFNVQSDDSWYSADSGDGVDVIHRQHDIGNNITDGTFERDFDIGGVESAFNSTFTLGLPDTLAPYVDGVRFTLGGTEYVVDGLTAATFDAWVDNLEDELAANAALADIVVTTPSDGVVVLTDPAGRTFVENTSNGWILTSGSLPSDGLDAWYQEVGAPQTDETLDRLIYKAYEDRSDNEGVDDDAVTGSDITLGRDAYAEDLVVDFAADGTRLAEDQSYTLTFDNLTTEDTVTITVNGVTYTLQVGVSVNGTQVDAEDGVFDTQASIQTAFLARLAGFINSFMDDDTAAGSISAAATATTLTLTQNMYTDGEETVFMKTPTVEITNESGGERASVSVTNNSAHEVQLLNYIASSLSGQLTRSDRDDGSDAAFNEDNVLFIGEEFVNQATLATAIDAGQTINGHDADVINGGADDLIGIAHNLATDDELVTDIDGASDANNGNFAVHGDDYLIGGTGSDVLNGGTGDDRIRGSLGTDTVDGGKDLYAVRVVGQSKYAVEVLNAYEATQRDASPDVLDLYLIEQTESADEMINGSNFENYFDDTLIFHQADFHAGQSRFTITLNDFVDMAAGASGVRLAHGGAGIVDVDVTGDGTFESRTTFTNFENIRTVSGVSRAVAGDGQGYDTLNVTALSDATGGVYYNLTNDPAWAGEVWVDTDAGTTIDGYEQYVITVDGVENVIGGTGFDRLVIDETEAAKNNLFSAGNDASTSTDEDIIEYYNQFDDGDDVEPTVTIHVQSSADTDQVVMTNGRVGTTVATDTLVGVEIIALYENTAEGMREDDTLDVTAVTTDVLVDFVNTEVRTDTNGDGDFTDAGEKLVEIVGMNELEFTLTDANDYIRVADVTYMSGNARSDTSATDLILDTYLNIDSLDDDLNRETIADMRANNELYNNIPQARNFEQFTFNTGVATDRVDYSSTNDQISALVAIEADTNYVFVNGGKDDDGYDDAGDRVDALIAAEEIVASTGQSILDFTQIEQDVTIRFQFDENNADASIDRLESMVRIGDDKDNTIEGIPNFVEYYDLDDDDDIAAFANAAWTRIEGGDFAEAVFYDGSEDLVNLAGVDHRYTDDELYLRGGENNVSYFALETSIDTTIVVEEFDADDALNTGYIHATVDFEDGNEGALAGAGQHNIWSYTGDNGIAEGSLKLEATQDAEDKVTFSTVSDKVFILGLSAGVLEVQIGELDAMRLTGFEFLVDANTDDTYDMRDLEVVQGSIGLTDNAADDHDAVKVGDDAIAFDGGPAVLTAAADTISLEVLNDVFGFDFDVLDITNVTDSGVIVVGDDDDQDNDATLNAADNNYVGPGDHDDDGDLDVARELTVDEVVVGSLSLLASITGFDTVVMTEATVDDGDTFTLDTTGSTLTQGSTSLAIGTNTISFGGLVREVAFGDSYVADVTAGVTVDVVDDGAVGVEVIGGDGNDTITGSGGSDTFRGNGGNDTLDGGIASEVRNAELSLGFDAVVDAPAIVLTMGTGGLTLTLNEIATPVDTDPDAGNDLDISAGATTDQVGAALVSLVNANIDEINAVANAFEDAANNDIPLLSASWDSVNDVISFTFAAGYDVVTADTIAITVSDGQLVAPATAATLTDGNSGGLNTYIFEATGALNGSDSILSFKATDALDFTAFATDNAPTGAEVADGTDIFGAVANNDILLVVDADGSVNTAAEVAAFFGATDVAASANVVVAVRDTQAGGDTTLWYIDNDANQAITAAEVTLVGTLVDFNSAALVDANIVD